MQRYILRRLLQALVTLWALSLFVFISVRLTGDPAQVLIAADATVEDYQRLRANLGLDEPLYVQYFVFLGNIAEGDFGESYISRRSVKDLLFERLPNTLELAGAAFLFAVVVGVPLGVLSALRRNTFIDSLTRSISVLGMSMPNFWVAIMLVLLFGAVLKWLPTYGYGDLRHLILPTVVLGWAGMAGMARLGRSSMIEVLESDYVRFARIKGLSERKVIFKHALKNASLPLLSYMGLTLGGLLNGAVAVEVVFAWPGLGRLMLQGVSQRDYNLVQATVLAAGFFYILTSMIVDILYAYVNPKIRYGR